MECVFLDPMKYFLTLILVLSLCFSVQARKKQRPHRKKVVKRSYSITRKIEKDQDVLDPDTLRFLYHSQKTGIDLDTTSNLNLYYLMYNWVGTPYQFGGSTKNGIDCSGFTKMLVAEIYKINLTRDSRSMFKQCNPVAKSALKEGDLVFFNIARGQISHVGVYLGNNKFIHSSTQKGVIMSDLREGYYKRYFYKGGRLIPLEIK